MTPKHHNILSEAAKAVRKIDDDLSQVVSELYSMDQGTKVSLDFRNVSYAAKECDRLRSAMERLFWVYPEEDKETDEDQEADYDDRGDEEVHGEVGCH